MIQVLEIKKFGKFLYWITLTPVEWSRHVELRYALLSFTQKIQYKYVYLIEDVYVIGSGKAS